MKGHDDVMDRWKAPRQAKIGDLTALAGKGSINTHTHTQESRKRRVARRGTRSDFFVSPLFESTATMYLDSTDTHQCILDDVYCG